MTTVDLAGIEDAALRLLAALIMLGLMWLLNLVRTRLNLNISATEEARYETAADKSLQAGISSTDALIKQKGWDHADVKNAVVASAATYAVAKFPDAIAAMGIDLSDPTHAAAGLEKGIMTRKFPDAVAKAAASPATPPAALPLPITDSQQAMQNRLAAVPVAPTPSAP